MKNQGPRLQVKEKLAQCSQGLSSPGRPWLTGPPQCFSVPAWDTSGRPLPSALQAELPCLCKAFSPGTSETAAFPSLFLMPESSNLIYAPWCPSRAGKLRNLRQIGRQVNCCGLPEAHTQTGPHCNPHNRTILTQPAENL